MGVSLSLVGKNGSASMKAFPKRKGDVGRDQARDAGLAASMKALPKRKGNASLPPYATSFASPASMKALPKRKGNGVFAAFVGYNVEPQ